MVLYTILIFKTCIRTIKAIILRVMPTIIKDAYAMIMAVKWYVTCAVLCQEMFA